MENTCRESMTRRAPALELDPANDNARRFVAEMEEELAAVGGA